MPNNPSPGTLPSASPPRGLKTRLGEPPTYLLVLPRRLFRASALLATLLTLSGTSFAGQISLAWDAVANATGYKVYYGTATRSYSTNIDAKNQTTYTVTGLTNGAKYYFAVADYNATTTSGYSNEVSAVVPTTTTAAPVASFSASTTNGTAPLTVNFTDTSTGSVTAWSWTFGDGGTSTAKNPSYVFSKAGTYTVALTVTGSGGTNAKTMTNYVTVSAPTSSPTSSGAGGSAVTVNNLVAAYGFEEVSGTQVLDASGNANHGTISGAIRVATTQFGNAIKFSGAAGNWVTVNDSNSLDLTTGMTVEAWVYPTALNGWATVLMKEQPGTPSYWLYANDNASRPSNVVNVGGTYRQLSAGSRLPTNTWTHLAATYDGSTQKLYVNGVLTGSRTQTGPIVTSGSPLRIGGNSIWGEYFTGYIDEVRVYNRALTQTEIAADSKLAVVGLLMSTSSTRSNSVPLNGVSVASATTRYIYISHGLISPTATSNPVSKVEFWLDNPSPSNPTGSARSIDYGSPFDFAGTASNGTALALDIGPSGSGLSTGVHRVTARVTLKNGTVLPVINGTFTKQ